MITTSNRFVVFARVNLPPFIFVSFFSNNRWGLCPNGYYLNGVRISGKYYLSQIQEARCCRPQNHPNTYEDCYDEDARNSLAQNDWSECKQTDYYMTGFYRGSCNYLHCMERLRCCKMKPGNIIPSMDLVLFYF